MNNLENNYRIFKNVVVVTFLYVLFSTTNRDWNLFNWENFIRYVFYFISVIVTIAIHFSNNDDKNNYSF